MNVNKDLIIQFNKRLDHKTVSIKPALHVSYSFATHIQNHYNKHSFTDHVGGRNFPSPMEHVYLKHVKIDLDYKIVTSNSCK